MKRELKGGKPSFLIVGAGPAGLVLGILLSRKGYPTVILERERGPHRQVCGEYLSPQGVECLNALGLGRVMEGFASIWGMEMSSSGGNQVLARFPEDRHGMAINRREFLSRLGQEYRNSGGLLFYGEILMDVERTENGLRILSSGSEYRCDGLIGADGRSSQVAKIMGLERLPSKNPRVAIHAYLKPRRPLPPFGQMHIFADGSYAGINPISDKEVNFSIVSDARLLKSWDNAKNLVNHHLKEHPILSKNFHPLEEEVIKTTYPIDCFRNEIVNGRTVLIGDASGFIDPLTGEGITTAIKTATLLFEEIEREPTVEEAFLSYAKARRRDWRQKEHLNHVLQKVIRRPMLCEWIAYALRAFPRARSLFIGVIGNIYTPAEAARKLILGGSRYGKDCFRTKRISQTPPLAAGGDESIKDRLA